MSKENDIEWVNKISKISYDCPHQPFQFLDKEILDVRPSLNLQDREELVKIGNNIYIFYRFNLETPYGLFPEDDRRMLNRLTKSEDAQIISPNYYEVNNEFN